MHTAKIKKQLDNKFIGKMTDKDCQIPKNGLCIFCQRDFHTPDGFGKILSNKGLKMHYFCLLFSSGLEQVGDVDEHDLCGFMIKHVIKEYQRAKKLKCFWCKKTGASVGCNVKQCRKTYHFPCSLETDILNQYYGSFSSYCHLHRSTFPLNQEKLNLSTNITSPIKHKQIRRRHSTNYTPKKKIKKEIKTIEVEPESESCNSLKILSRQPTSDIICLICRDEIVELKEFKILLSKCCEKAYYHRECIQNQAFHSGYLFQCPACCNKDTFRDHMLQMGIYIPERDASWEREENPYMDLYNRPEVCSYNDCGCPNGQSYKKVATLWEIVLCAGCGSFAVHLSCAGLQMAGSHIWYCWDCKPIFGNEQRDPCFSGEGLTQPRPRKRRLPASRNGFAPYGTNCASTSSATTTSNCDSLESDLLPHGSRERNEYESELSSSTVENLIESV